ncbi:MAG: F0F1 ATP synthase subunit B [candidate division Zixibacteria bacterium]|nr:F0F1 ATP synthase subunit B [candidate division Zixibacteria bacterium]
MGGILDSLGVKGPELLTQIIGFIIAVWILKKFAWKPLLGMLEQRRTKIQGDLESAEKTKEEAAEVLVDYQNKLKDIDTEARTKIQEAIADGNKVAAEVREQARAEAKDIIGKARDELARDVAKAKIELRNDMVNMAVNATERIISERLDDEKHRELINGFLDEVEKIK